MSFIKEKLQPFKHALNGIISASKEEWPFTTHYISAAAAIAGGFFFGITKAEWLAVVICIGMVIAMELVNTAIERLCDAVIPEQNPKIKFVKDASAGSVMIASIAAGITGIIIFFPYIKQLITG